MTPPALEFDEVCRQEYGENNCVISAGIVRNHPVEDAYIKLEKDGEEPTLIMVRADELLALSWVATGTAWSLEMERRFGERQDEG